MRGASAWRALFALAEQWSELDDGFGGITGGMQGLIKHVTTRSLDWPKLKVRARICHRMHAAPAAPVAPAVKCWCGVRDLSWGL